MKRIVGVHESQALQSAARLNLADEVVPPVGRVQGHPRSECMARIDADTQARRGTLARVQASRQLLHAPAESPPSSGGVLEEQPRAFTHRPGNLERLIHGFSDALRRRSRV